MIVLGDFNQCVFQSSVPTYQQTATCPTRGNITLEKMYCNIRNNYRAYRQPKLGDGDHMMVFLTPTYVQKLKSEPCVKISIREWNNEENVTLHSCFEHTDWETLYSESENIN